MNHDESSRAVCRGVHCPIYLFRDTGAISGASPRSSAVLGICWATCASSMFIKLAGSWQERDIADSGNDRATLFLSLRTGFPLLSGLQCSSLGSVYGEQGLSFAELNVLTQQLHAVLETPNNAPFGLSQEQVTRPLAEDDCSCITLGLELSFPKTYAEGTIS